MDLGDRHGLIAEHAATALEGLQFAHERNRGSDGWRSCSWQQRSHRHRLLQHDAGEVTDAPTTPACPDCATPLVHVKTEISSGAFRTQAASMPQIPIHYYDCPACNTCWKLGQRLLPDPVRQILKG